MNICNLTTHFVHAPLSLRDIFPTLGEELVSFVYKAYAEALASKTFLFLP